MGCDIHCYIEYQSKETGRWNDFGGKINPGRNYYMFSLLAGVRGEESSALFPPRGLPDNLGYSSANDSRLFITDTDGEHCLNKETAAKWVEQHISEYILLNDNPIWVTHPDWHSHSWLTTKEYQEVLKKYDETEKKCDEIKYRVILETMKSLEKLSRKARLVFWFDN